MELLYIAIKRMNSFISIALLVTTPIFVHAGTISATTTCPGAPVPITIKAKNVTGSCTINSSLVCPHVDPIPGQIINTQTDIQTIFASSSCTFTHICNSKDPIGPGNVSKQIDAIITVNPNQSICCGNYDLENYSQWNASTGKCENPPPTLELSGAQVVSYVPYRVRPPTYAADGTLVIAAGDTVVFNATATDSTPDVDRIGFTWLRPNGALSGPGLGGGSSFMSNPKLFSPVTTLAIGQLDFAPTDFGTYQINFYVRDNASVKANGLPPRLTYGTPVKVKVISKVIPVLKQDPSDIRRIVWQCTNAQRVTLEEVYAGATTTLFSKIVPPVSGSFVASTVPGTKYVLTCTNTNSGEFNYSTFYQPSIEATNITNTTARIDFNCGDPRANRNTFSRTPGYSNTYTQQSRTINDSGLTPGRLYTYSITCKSLQDGITTILGVATVRITTIATPVPSFSLSAYMQGQPSDPAVYSSTEPITANSPDGQFHAWSYKITNGTAASCSMDQASDGGEWYPAPGYATDPVGHTQTWSATDPADQVNPGTYSTLTTGDKTLFANGFAQTHYWRLTCIDNQNRSTSLTWEVKKIETLPSVLGANLNVSCTPLPATASIEVECNNSDYYEVNDTSVSPAVRVGFGSGNGGTVALPGPGTYNTVCKQGGVSGITSSEKYQRIFDTAMCNTTIDSLSATPRTVRAGSQVAIQWVVNKPDNSCSLEAEAVCSQGSGSACDLTRQTDAAAMTSFFHTGYTDQNDPNNSGPRRLITDALQKPVRDDGSTNKSSGKTSVKVKYSTDIILRCTTAPTVEKRVRVQVSNDQEG